MDVIMTLRVKQRRIECLYVIINKIIKRRMLYRLLDINLGERKANFYFGITFKKPNMIKIDWICK